MSSLNDYIKFTLDIKDQYVIFSDYSNENINGKIYKTYLADLIQPACPYCRSTNLKHNGHYVSNARFITADASKPVIIRLRKQCVLCNDCLKDQWLSLILLIKAAISLTLLSEKYFLLLRTRFKPDILHYFYKFLLKLVQWLKQ